VARHSAAPRKPKKKSAAQDGRHCAKLQAMSASDPKALGSGSAPETQTQTKKPLSPAAERALAEAAARRTEREGKTAEQAKEPKGHTGPDPARYGDWENKGLAKDF
jgi:hypothetical protein